jgi:PAS domain S-box-containing protein
MPSSLKNSKKKSIAGKNIYLSLVDNSPEAILLINEAGHIQYQNHAAAKISGQELYEITETPVFDFVHPEDIGGGEAFLSQPSLTPGEQKTKLLRIKHIDNSYRWIEATVINMLHQSDIKGFIITCHDVTDKKQIENENSELIKELEQSSAEASDYKFALDASAVITVVDVSGKIKYVNDNFCKLTGFTRGDVLGRNPRMFNSGYHSKEFFKDLWDTVLAGKVWKGEIRNRKKGGGIYWGDTTIVPFINMDGKPYQFLVIRNDITSKKDSEQKLAEANRELQRLFNNVNEVLFSVDVKENKVTQMSPSCVRLYGYEQQDFYNDRYLWHKVIHPDDQHIIKNHFANLSQGLEMQDEYRIIHKDGSIRWFASSIVPTLDQDKVLERVDGVITDITERKNMEAELLKSSANLKAIVQNAEAGYVLMDKDFNILTFNELVKKWDDEFFHFNIHVGANYLRLAPENLAEENLIISRRLLGGGAVERERCWQKPDGTLFWYFAKTNIIRNEQGKISGFVLELNDITQHKEYEQKLATANNELNRLFNSVHEVLYSVDMLKYKVTQISSACKTVYGYTPE